MDYLDVEKARKLSGVRLALTVGVPGPWSEAAKNVLNVKKIHFAAVRQDAGQPNQALREWTGHDNAPTAMYEDERPRTTWPEILLLAERLKPEPRLVPKDAAERARMFGYVNEICGEMGFGWCRRLMLIHQILRVVPDNEIGLALARKYGFESTGFEQARARVGQILELLSERLREQRAAGSRFFIEDRLSGLDLLWAAFSVLVDPMPEELCPLGRGMRKQYTLTDAELLKRADPLLTEHRDFIYHNFLELPLDF